MPINYSMICNAKYYEKISNIPILKTISYFHLYLPGIISSRHMIGLGTLVVFSSALELLLLFITSMSIKDSLPSLVKTRSWRSDIGLPTIPRTWILTFFDIVNIHFISICLNYVVNNTMIYDFFTLDPFAPPARRTAESQVIPLTS